MTIVGGKQKFTFASALPASRPDKLRGLRGKLSKFCLTTFHYKTLLVNLVINEIRLYQFGIELLG